MERGFWKSGRCTVKFNELSEMDAYTEQTDTARPSVPIQFKEPDVGIIVWPRGRVQPNPDPLSLVLFGQSGYTFHISTYLAHLSTVHKTLSQDNINQYN